MGCARSQNRRPLARHSPPTRSAVLKTQSAAGWALDEILKSTDERFRNPPPQKRRSEERRLKNYPIRTGVGGSQKGCAPLRNVSVAKWVHGPVNRGVDENASSRLVLKLLWPPAPGRLPGGRSWGSRGPRICRLGPGAPHLTPQSFNGGRRSSGTRCYRIATECCKNATVSRK